MAWDREFAFSAGEQGSSGPAKRDPWRCRRAVGTGGLGESTGRAIGDFHRALPWQAISFGGEILHVGVWTILRAAIDRNIAAVAELIDVVLDPPADACLVALPRPDSA